MISSVKRPAAIAASALALALERVGVRLLARDAVLPRQHLGRLSHDQIRQRAEEAVAVHRVDEREVAHLVAPARVFAVDQIRHAAHRLDAAGEHELRLAERIACAPSAIVCKPGRARLIDRLRRRRVRQAGAAAHLSRRIRPGSGLTSVTEKHFVESAARRRRARSPPSPRGA